MQQKCFAFDDSFKNIKMTRNRFDNSDMPFWSICTGIKHKDCIFIVCLFVNGIKIPSRPTLYQCFSPSVMYCTIHEYKHPYFISGLSSVMESDLFWN